MEKTNKNLNVKKKDPSKSTGKYKIIEKTKKNLNNLPGKKNKIDRFPAKATGM